MESEGDVMSLDMTPVHRNLHTKVTFLGLEFEDLILVLALAALMNLLAHFVSGNAHVLPWLQSLDSIAVNGRHAIFLAEGLVRVEMLRTVRTCELAITLHTLSHMPGRNRPEVSSAPLFRGRDGVLPLDLWRDEHRALRGKLTPMFYDRAGEVVQMPQRFAEAIRKVTAAVCCVGCKHSHVGVPPVAGGLRP
jgi:hypothetical protein